MSVYLIKVLFLYVTLLFSCEHYSFNARNSTKIFVDAFELPFVVITYAALNWNI